MAEQNPLWFPLLFNVRSMKLNELLVNTLNSLFYLLVNMFKQ